MLKKKYLITFISVVIIAAIIIAYNYVNNKNNIGIINMNTKDLESTTSVITFNGKEGDHAEIEFESKEKKGNWHLQLVLSDNIIYTFKTDELSKDKFQLPEDGEYRLEAVSDEFVGKVKIRAKLRWK